MTRAATDGELAMLRHILWAKLPAPAAEYRFDERRRWRFDFAWPQLRVALEVEGGTHAGGRHTRGGGFEADCEKYNAAAIEGWMVLRVTTDMVEDGRALDTLRKAIGTAVSAQRALAGRTLDG